MQGRVCPIYPHRLVKTAVNPNKAKHQAKICALFPFRQKNCDSAGFPGNWGKADAVFASALQVQGQSFDALTGLCAPELSPATAYRIAFEFSGGKPWAVSIRGGSVVAADSEEHALALIRNLKEKGKSVSIGFFQIPEEFISHSGSDLESALEPCRNLKMGSAFLFSRYRDYLGRHGMNFLAARQALEDLRAASGRGTPVHALNRKRCLRLQFADGNGKSKGC